MTTTTDYINSLYSNFLGREADSEGTAYWTAQLDFNGMTRAEVAQSFIASAEVQDVIGAIARLFEAVFDRIPDNDGLDYWTDQLRDGTSLQEVAAGFTASEEFQSAYGGTSDSEFLTQIYNNVLGRNPDDAGLAYWTEQLADGMTRADLVLNFSESAENTAAKSAQVQTIVAYKGLTGDVPTEDQLLIGKNVALSNLVSTLATNSSTIDLDGDGETGSGGSTGTTFTLTNTTDAFTGDASNDVFIGDSSSVSAGDTLVGGAGTDTLKLFGTNTAPNYSGIENVYLNAPGGNFDVSSKSDVTSLEMEAETGSRTLTVTSDQAVTLTNVSGGQTTTIAGNDPTSLDLTLDKAGSSTSDHTVALSGTALATLNVTGENNASYATLTNAGGALTTINVAGDTAVTLGHALTTVTAIDASSATGDVTIDAIGASNLTFTGGTGDDKIAMAATLTSADTITGGDGTDTFSVSDADTMDTTSETANVSGFEVFEAAAADGTTYDVSKLTSNNSLTGLVVSSTGAGTTTVSNLTSTMDDAISITGDAPASIVLSAAGFVSGGTSDQATITLDNSVNKNADGVDISTSLTFANADKLNIVSTSDGTPASGEQNSITGLIATDLETITVTGDQELSLALGAGSTGVGEIDASGLSRAFTLDTNDVGSTSLLVRGTAKADTLTVDSGVTGSNAAAVTIFAGGAGAGTDTVNTDAETLATADTLVYTATSLNSGDLLAGDTLAVVQANDLDDGASDSTEDETILTLNLAAEIEALLKVAGTTLSSTSSDIAIDGQTLGSTTNIAATLSGGDVTLQMDLNGDGSFNSGDDWQMTVDSETAILGVNYDASEDYFVFMI